jgi:hypothetical protein
MFKGTEGAGDGLRPFMATVEYDALASWAITSGEVFVTSTAWLNWQLHIGGGVIVLPRTCGRAWEAECRQRLFLRSNNCGSG